MSEAIAFDALNLPKGVEVAQKKSAITFVRGTKTSRLVAEKILDIIKNKKSVKKPWQHFATKYITIEELMKNAKPCTLIKDVHEEIVKEMNSPERQAKDAKRMADIAGIMNKVVGAE